MNVTGAIDEFAPVVSWDDFQGAFRWTQGEHMAFIGPTGSGKTVLSLSLLDLREYVVAFSTKPRDKSMSALARRGYEIMRDWDPKKPAWKYPRRILWPDATTLYSDRIQQEEFRYAMAEIYRVGCWCVYVDELWWFIHKLKMEQEIRTYLQQARALKISLVVATQRPSRVPLEVYDQSSHLFFWLDNDEPNLRRLGGISFLSAKIVRETVARLDRYQFLYINTKSGKAVRSTAPKHPAPLDKHR